MKRFTPSLFMLSLLYLLQATHLNADPIQLPIEVYGPVDGNLAPVGDVFGPLGHIESIEFELTAAQSEEADSVWLRLHNISYYGKARVNINGQGWLALWNDTTGITVSSKDAAYGGFGGGFQTIECTVDNLSDVLNEGTNRIEFEFHFKHEDFATAGYRVIGLNVMNGSGVRLLPAESFVWDNPSVWSPPLTGALNISAGENLWRSPIPGGTASCSECHTRDGFDLKYFNVSNKVIIQQALKSGFSNLEANQIASYIRSRPYSVVPEARPWNPPYQPGPDIETRTNAAYKWAAGAGIEAVLDSDQGMIEELFGNENPTEAEVLQALDNYSTSPNVRTQRLSVQFPDWISWLPRTHPKDLISSTRMETLEQAYADLRTTAASATLNASVFGGTYNENGVFRALGEFARQVHLQVAYSPYDAGPNSPIWTSLDRYGETEKRSLSAWYSVKLFEVINEFDLHTIDYVNIEEQYPFQWPTREWAVFQNAAHVISDQRRNSYFASDTTEQQRTKNIYLSSIWYQLQMTLTPGHELGGVVAPNDFAYNLNHVHKLGDHTGIHEPGRFLQNYWMAAAQRNNGLLPKDVQNFGQAGAAPQVSWNMREVSPYRLYGRVTPEVPGQPIDLTFKELENYQEGLQSRVQSAFFRATANVLSGFDYDQSSGDFERISLSDSMSSQRSDFQLEHRWATPEYGLDNSVNWSVFHHRRVDFLGVSDAVEVDAAYTLVRLLHRDQIVSDEAFNAIKDWVESAWDTESWVDWPVHYRILFDEDTKDTEPSDETVPESTYYFNLNQNAIDMRGRLEEGFAQNMNWDATDQIEGTHSGVFNGSNSYIRLGDTRLREEKSDLTVSAWIKPNSLTGFHYIYEQGSNLDGIGLRLNNNRVEAFLISNRSQTILQSPAITAGDWHFVAVTFDDGLVTLFVNDGTPVSRSVSSPIIAQSFNPCGIGNIAGFGGGHFESDNYAFDGMIDDVRIWDGLSLSQTQVASVYYAAFTAQLSRPVVAFTTPSSDSVIREAGVDQPFTVTASVADGSISSVVLSRYYSGWETVAEDSTSPYHWNGGTGLNDPNGLLANLAPGDYLFRAEASSTFGRKGTSYIRMTVNPTVPTAYGTWLVNNGLPDTEESRNGDSDQGRLVNLLEYAFGGDPNDATDDTSLIPDYNFVENAGSPYFEVHFNRRRDHSAVGLNYSVEVTTDIGLNDWNIHDLPTTATPLADPNYERVSSRVYVSEEFRYFVRIRVHMN